jgi:rod shape-determining protein MreC
MTSMKKTTSSFFDTIRFFFVDYVDLVNIKKENRDLINKNRILLVENSLVSIYKMEIEELKNALNFKRNYIKLNLAPIKNIVNNFTSINNSIIAENISNEVLEKDLGIITEDGVIGITDKIEGNKIKIIPITSKDISIPVWIGKDKLFAFATGTNNNKNLTLKLKYVENGVNIKPGDKIITNGYDSIFPEGIYIGEVIRVREIKNNIFVNIDVKLPEKLYDSKYFFVIKQ